MLSVTPEMSVCTQCRSYKIKNHWNIPFTVHAPQYAHPIAPYDSYYNYTMYTRTVDCTYTRATFYYPPSAPSTPRRACGASPEVWGAGGCAAVRARGGRPSGWSAGPRPGQGRRRSSRTASRARARPGRTVSISE